MGSSAGHCLPPQRPNEAKSSQVNQTSQKRGPTKAWKGCSARGRLHRPPARPHKPGAAKASRAKTKGKETKADDAKTGTKTEERCSACLHADEKWESNLLPAWRGGRPEIRLRFAGPEAVVAASAAARGRFLSACRSRAGGGIHSLTASPCLGSADRWDRPPPYTGHLGAAYRCVCAHALCPKIEVDVATAATP